MKRNCQSIKLLLVFSLVLLLSISSTITCHADVSPTPQVPTLGTDQFLFIESHMNLNGIGDLGSGMMMDFQTYSYSPTTKILISSSPLQDFSPETKVILGSGASLSGTAGGGGSTALHLYDSFSSEGLFFVDPDFTLHFYMEDAWRVVAPGESWTKQIEEHREGYTGKYIRTFSVTNYGVLKKSDIKHPPLITLPPTSTPKPTSTPTPEINEYKICGYVRPDPPLLMESDGANFKFEITEIGLFAKSDPSGYYEISGVPKLKSGTSYTLKISKPGYLTRIIKNLWIDRDLEIGSTSNRISMLSGDVNDDGAINMADIFVLAKAFNTTYSDSKFSKTADLNYDNAINMSDVMIIAGNFNNSSSSYTTPYMANLFYYNLKVNDSFIVTDREATLAGVTWDYSINDSTVVGFNSLITSYDSTHKAVQNIWSFNALSKGSAVITFEPSDSRNIQKHIVTVTEGTTVSPTATTVPDKEPEVVDSKDLKSTLISTDSEQDITTGKNIVYCPTFQMAWDEFKKIIGGDIKLSGDPILATILNKGFPMTDSLSPDSYVAMAGFGQDTVDEINSALKIKFGDSAPQITTKLDDSSIIAYSYLWKNICFAKTFESISTPFNFKSGNTSVGVKSFGIPYHSNKANDLAKQVKIYDYKSKADFIVKLIPENDTDEIILAKTAPKDNLYETFTSVMDRINNSTPSGFNVYYDSLQIPVMDFNISHNYTELQGKLLQNQSFNNYTITKANQTTRFKLDEKGAILASQATIIAVPSIEHPEGKELTFDGPFMIILKEKNAVNPYLMIWVDNPELFAK